MLYWVVDGTIVLYWVQQQKQRQNGKISRFIEVEQTAGEKAKQHQTNIVRKKQQKKSHESERIRNRWDGVCIFIFPYNSCLPKSEKKISKNKVNVSEWKHLLLAWSTGKKKISSVKLSWRIVIWLGIYCLGWNEENGLYQWKYWYM